MYLLKHICIEFNSVINQLIGAKVLTTSAYLFSPGANTSTTSQVRFIAGAAMKSNNGHVNTKNFHNIAIPNHRVNQLRITITGGVAQ
jgi:hypothetical protein